MIHGYGLDVVAHWGAARPAGHQEHQAVETRFGTIATCPTSGVLSTVTVIGHFQVFLEGFEELNSHLDWGWGDKSYR
jgi:hypothetical protein